MICWLDYNVYGRLWEDTHESHTFLWLQALRECIYTVTSSRDTKLEDMDPRSKLLFNIWLHILAYYSHVTDKYIFSFINESGKQNISKDHILWMGWFTQIKLPLQSEG